MATRDLDRPGRHMPGRFNPPHLDPQMPVDHPNHPGNSLDPDLKPVRAIPPYQAGPGRGAPHPLDPGRRPRRSPMPTVPGRPWWRRWFR